MLNAVYRAFTQHRAAERAEDAGRHARREAEDKAFRDTVTKSLTELATQGHAQDTRLAAIEAVQKDRNHVT